MPKRPFRTVTSQGTEILVEPLPHVRSCSVGFWVKRGSCFETAQEEGLAHLIEHTVFKGTERYPGPQAMAEATDRLGGNVDAFTGKETACFYGKVLREQLPALVDLLGELVTTPRFDEDELARERKVILEEISQSEDQPDDWVNELFYANFWPGGTLAHPILGTRDQVAGYGAAQARAFFRKTYRAPNLLIAAAGDIETDAFLELLQPILALIPRGLEGDGVWPSPNQSRPFLLNTPRKELQQASLAMGFPAFPHQHPDRAAVNLLGYVLGGGMSSRLFMELREKHALCYQVGSYLSQYRDTGALQIAASCAPDRAQELVRRTVAECARLRREGVTADELERAKLQLRTSLVLNQESTSSRMFALAHQAIHMDRLLTLDQQIQEIDRVDLDQVRRVAEAVLVPEAFGVSALGTGRATGIRPRDLLELT
jgi:predicted Zn-dependent peptidase